jgi:hypothetical protein
MAIKVFRITSNLGGEPFGFLIPGCAGVLKMSNFDPSRYLTQVCPALVIARVTRVQDSNDGGARSKVILSVPANVDDALLCTNTEFEVYEGKPIKVTMFNVVFIFEIMNFPD